MARVDEAPEDRDQLPLKLSQLEECGLCGTLQEVEFVAPEGVYDVQELVDAPETVHTCVDCGYEAEVTYAGWTSTEEA